MSSALATDDADSRKRKRGSEDASPDVHVTNSGRTMRPRRAAAVSFGENDTDDDEDEDASRLDVAVPKEKRFRGQNTGETFCICKKPYDPTSFMIGCDHCYGWFHPKCVDVSITQARNIVSYTCPSCAEKRKIKPAKKTRKVKSRKKYTDDGDYSSVVKNLLGNPDFSCDDDSCVDLTSDEDPDQEHLIVLKSSAVLAAWDQEVLEALREELTGLDHCTGDLAVAQWLRARVVSGTAALADLKHKAVKFMATASYIEKISAGRSVAARASFSDSHLSCVKCHGSFPVASYSRHLDVCVETPGWKDEDTKSRFICGHPVAATLFTGAASEQGFCPTPRKTCTAHAGWELVTEVGLLRQEYLLERRLEHFQDELELVQARIDGQTRPATIVNL